MNEDHGATGTEADATEPGPGPWDVPQPPSAVPALAGGRFTILQTEDDVPWLPHPNTCQLVLADTPPPAALVPAAFAFAFSGDRLLLARLIRRGLEVPGGHVESGESPEQAVVREAREEAGAHLTAVRALAYQRHQIRCGRPDGYPFPYPENYMSFYTARVLALEEVVPGEETAGAVLLGPDAARAVPWVRAHLALYEAALRRATAGTT